MSMELKPCPFCGGEATIEPKNWAGRDYIGVFCNECLIFQDGRSATDAEAITAWNTRTNSQDALIAELASDAQFYMSQFGQGLEAHGIAYGPSQREADERLRATLAKVHPHVG